MDCLCSHFFFVIFKFLKTLLFFLNLQNKHWLFVFALFFVIFKFLKALIFKLAKTNMDL